MSLYYIDGGGGKGRGGGNPTVVTDADNTNLEVAGNTIYDFGDTPITELKITSVAKSYKESIIFFVTGAEIEFSAPNTIKWGGDGSVPSLDINTRYCIAICNEFAEIDNFGTVS